jgi:hypothetical protein
VPIAKPPAVRSTPSSRASELILGGSAPPYSTPLAAGHRARPLVPIHQCASAESLRPHGTTISAWGSQVRRDSRTMANRDRLYGLPKALARESGFISHSHDVWRSGPARAGREVHAAQEVLEARVGAQVVSKGEA